MKAKYEYVHTLGHNYDRTQLTILVFSPIVQIFRKELYKPDMGWV